MAFADVLRALGDSLAGEARVPQEARVQRIASMRGTTGRSALPMPSSRRRILCAAGDSRAVGGLSC